MPTVQKASDKVINRLAVSLIDLDRLPPDMRRKVASKLDPTILALGPSPCTPCLAFKCSLVEAAMVCDYLRNCDRLAGDEPTELYLYRPTVWTRVAADAVFTVVSDDEKSISLNLAEFDVEVKPIPARPLTPKRI